MPISGITTTTDGYFPSHASKTVRLLGLKVGGVKEVKYKCTVSRTPVIGAAREVLGWTIGNVAYEFSITVYRPDWLAFKARAASMGRAVMDAQGLCTVTTSERGYSAETVEARVAGLSDAEGSSSGTDPNEVAVTFNVSNIKENGVAMVERSVY